jgi:hypothetical protein
MAKAEPLDCNFMQPACKNDGVKKDGQRNQTGRAVNRKSGLNRPPICYPSAGNGLPDGPLNGPMPGRKGRASSFAASGGKSIGTYVNRAGTFLVGFVAGKAIELGVARIAVDNGFSGPVLQRFLFGNHWLRLP